MNHEAIAQLATMLNTFPQGSANPDLTMRAYKQDLQGFEDSTICEIARRYRCGEVPGQSDKFAPSSAQFIQRCRIYEEGMAAKNAPRLPPPVYSKTPMEIDHERRRQKFAGRKIIKENVTHAEWIEGSNRKKWPVGATWSAALGVVYG